MTTAHHAYHCALCSAREGESYEAGDLEASEARLTARVSAAGWVDLPGDQPRRRWQLIICGDCAAELRALLAAPCPLCCAAHPCQSCGGRDVCACPPGEHRMGTVAP